jgi:hypothetical protein
MARPGQQVNGRTFLLEQVSLHQIEGCYVRIRVRPENSRAHTKVFELTRKFPVEVAGRPIRHKKQ